MWSRHPSALQIASARKLFLALGGNPLCQTRCAESAEGFRGALPGGSGALKRSKPAPTGVAAGGPDMASHVATIAVCRGVVAGALLRTDGINN